MHSARTQLALVMTVDDFAAALQVARRTIVRMIDRGELRATKIGKCVRIPRSELDRILSADARAAG